MDVVYGSIQTSLEHPNPSDIISFIEDMFSLLNQNQMVLSSYFCLIYETIREFSFL